MQLLYGNYDTQTQSSAANLPDLNTRYPDQATEQPMIVRPIFHALTTEVGVQKFVLLTYGVPANGGFNCHACGPTMGMAVFADSSKGWTIEAFRKAVTSSGEWGEPSVEIQLVQIGPNHHAIQITNHSSGQGEGRSALDILVPWKRSVRVAYHRIIGNGYEGSDPQASEDSEGSDEPQGLPSYSNKRKLSFVPQPGAEYYDLKIELSGTDMVSPEPRKFVAKEVSGTEILKLENGKYVRRSHQGDVTISADR